MIKLVEISFEASKRETNNIIGSELFQKCIKELKAIIKGKRNLMYTDIIVIILKRDYKGEDADNLIRLCSQKTKKGIYFIESE